ncbi:uncharacterized protein LOC119744420 [Patiria miniata]|uniref:Uncharacterized protein n=1 Tax=Patiria miniata TaxID=46514 RepID=A0A914BJ12_PATMI|nr:uncharacterized protein LOC119744420 [Patiria miniata]
MSGTEAATGPMMVDAVTPSAAGDAGGSGTDVNIIITVAACIGGLFLVVLIIFIIFVIYFYRKQLKDDELDKKNPSLRADRLDWKQHSLAHQFGDINDVDVMLWTDRGRKANDETDNPAFGKDFEPLDVNNLRRFDLTDDEAGSAQETESTGDMVEINLDEEDEEDNPGAPDTPGGTKQISILDMNTWGQPGTSRHNSVRSVRGLGPPPSFEPRSPDARSQGGGSLRSQNGSPFPYASYEPEITPRQQTLAPGSQRGLPFTVSNPSNDPRFQYTRTNPLMAEAVGRSTNDKFPFSAGEAAGYSSHVERDFGGTEDITSVEFDRSSNLRGSRRNQSVVDFYESGTRTTGSSFSLALEGSGSIGKNLLWQNKSFGGITGMMGMGNNTK